MFNFNFIRKIKKFFFPFYKNSDLKFVFKKLQQDFPSRSKAAMFVGGCVRKHLLNEEIDDIDIATSLNTDQIKKRFEGTKFNVIDSGITHGTVTLVSKELKLELTTLRKDIKTDGRHAEIEYTHDWEEDSEHLPTFDEIRDDMQNHPGSKALERAKEKQEPKNIKIMKKAAEEYLKKQHQKHSL